MVQIVVVHILPLNFRWRSCHFRESFAIRYTPLSTSESSICHPHCKITSYLWLEFNKVVPYDVAWARMPLAYDH